MISVWRREWLHMTGIHPKKAPAQPSYRPIDPMAFNSAFTSLSQGQAGKTKRDGLDRAWRTFFGHNVCAQSKDNPLCDQKIGLC